MVESDFQLSVVNPCKTKEITLTNQNQHKQQPNGVKRGKKGHDLNGRLVEWLKSKSLTLFALTGAFFGSLTECRFFLIN